MKKEYLPGFRLSSLCGLKEFLGRLDERAAVERSGLKRLAAVVSLRTAAAI